MAKARAMITRHMSVFAMPLLAVTLLATACSHSSSGPGVANVGSSTPSGQASSSSSRSAGLLAFSRCMRSHGVPDFPDPEPGQTEVKLPPPNGSAYGASGALMDSAVRACHMLLPPGVGGWYPRSEIPLVLRAMRAFADCMRAHGISNWPDPSFDSQGRLGFTGPGADNPPGSPTDHAVNQCHHLLPPIVTAILAG